MKTRSWICILLAVVLCAAVVSPSAAAACAPGEHDYEVVEVIRQPTCSVKGIAKVECKICHYTINTYIDADPSQHVVGSYEVVKAATCTESGVMNAVCSKCQQTFTRAIPMLGHNWNADYTVDKAATCTEAGSKSIHCARCDAHKEDVVIEAAGHTPVDDAAVAPSCTEPGKTAGSHCSVCNAVLTAQETVPAAGHTPVDDAAVAPTCTESGKTAGSHCSVCNTVLTAQDTVPAAGHTPVDDAAVAPTCTEPGKTAGSHCSVCNTVLTAQETVPALNHDYVLEEKAPTCTEAGYKKSVCSRCADTIAEDLPALGHDMEYVPAKAASYTEEGSKAYYQCKRCLLKYWDEDGEKEARDEELVVAKLQKPAVSYAPAAPAPSAASYVEARLEKKTLTPAVSIVKGEAEITIRGNAETQPDYVKIKSVRSLVNMGAKSFCVEMHDKLHIALSFDAVKELLKLHGLTDAQIAAVNTVTVAFDEDEENILSVFCGDTELLRIDTESLLKDTNDVKEVLLTLDKDGISLSHDGKEIAKEEITLEGTLTLSLTEGKLVFEKTEKN